MPIVSPVRERLYGPLAAGFGKRVEEAARAIGSNAVAARAIGLSDDQLGKIIRELAVPNSVSMVTLALQSGFRLDWLFLARGPRKEDEMSTGTFISEGEAETAWIAALDHSATYPFAKEWIDRLAVRAADLRAFSMPNNAMEPTIARGDMLLLDTGKKVDFADGAIMALQHNGEVLVRRSQLEIDGSVILGADNPLFKVQKLERQQVMNVDVLGRVVWRGSSAL